MNPTYDPIGREIAEPCSHTRNAVSALDRRQQRMLLCAERFPHGVLVTAYSRDPDPCTLGYAFLRQADSAGLVAWSMRTDEFAQRCGVMTSILHHAEAWARCGVGVTSVYGVPQQFVEAWAHSPLRRMRALAWETQQALQGMRTAQAIWIEQRCDDICRSVCHASPAEKDGLLVVRASLMRCAGHLATAGGEFSGDVAFARRFADLLRLRVTAIENECATTYLHAA